jgi:hypothetical protein
MQPLLPPAHPGKRLFTMAIEGADNEFHSGENKNAYRDIDGNAMP